MKVTGTSTRSLHNGYSHYSHYSHHHMQVRLLARSLCDDHGLVLCI